ncbi:MAG: NUDIX hydrolase [Shinella sp.]|nr:NUDIX hydrolase [Shinella sp.]
MNILNRIASDVQLMFRRPARTQYAALCYRFKKKRTELEVLLITSRDTGRWVIPKGWPMADRPPHAAAAREAYEEAGVKGKVGETPIGSYDYQKGMTDGFKVGCLVQVYALEVDDLCKSYPEKGQRRIEWVSCEEAARRVNEPGLRDLLVSFEKTMFSADARAAAKNVER